MADTLARLVGPKTLETSTTAQYNSTGKTVSILEVHLSNPTTADINFTMSIGADAAGTRLFDAFPVPGNKGVLIIPMVKILVTGDGANAICAHASAAGLVATISGVEVT